MKNTPSSFKMSFKRLWSIGKAGFASKGRRSRKQKTALKVSKVFERAGISFVKEIFQ